MLTLFPNLTMLGIYDMRAKVASKTNHDKLTKWNKINKILNLTYFPVRDITGRGNLKASIVNTKMKMKITGNRYEKNGQTFVKYDKVTIKFQFGKTKVYLNNLFNDKLMLNLIGIDNQLGNDNWM